MNLDINEWKYFSIEQLFLISRGRTLSTENKDLYSGTIPCVNGTTENNGVHCFLSEEIQEIGFKLQKAPALSLARVGNAGMTFVQNIDFYIADNAFSLTLREQQSEKVYLFLSTILNLENAKYSYGRTVSLEKYKKLRIKLPALSDGHPDFCFMEKYILELHSNPIRTGIKHTEKTLNFEVWNEYLLGDLFDFSKGKRLTKADIVPGDVNFLGAISENNGIREKIETEHCWKENCITVNYNGSVGEAFYQDRPFWASDDVNVLYAKPWWKMNKYNALFIVTVIKANKYRFSYGRKWTLDKMKETVIKLPSCQDGTPDFDFMEQYIKALPYSDRI